MQISLFALSGLFIAVSSGIMVFVMFIFGKSALHRLWGFFCVSVFVWGLGGFFIGIADNPLVAGFWWRVTHVGVAFIPVLFLHFVHNFLEIKKPKTLLSFYALAFIFSFLALFSDTLIAQMRFVFNEFYYDSPPGILYPFFTAYFFGSTIYSHYLLYRGYSRRAPDPERDTVRKAHIRYFFFAMAVSFSGGSLSFLPVYGIDVYPFTNFMVTVYPVIVGYAILKLRLFDIRLVTAQALVLLLWLFVGVRLALSLGEKDFFINALFFALVILLGIFLVRSVGKEVEAREKIEHLAGDLKAANARLKELDERKSEFVSLASHQLRAPLTAIKGYSSMLLEGSFGELSEKIKDSVNKIFQSSNRLVAIVEDFLTISRIEQNRLQYAFEKTDLKKLVSGICEEMRQAIQKKGLTCSFNADEGLYVAQIDPGKISQVVGNLLNNAVEYSSQGEIKVSLFKNKDTKTFLLSVSDNGIGMTRETIEKLFQKFSRALDASKTSATGIGLGLYVADNLVRAHKGKIWAESEGPGKGSTFFVELPAVE